MYKLISSLLLIVIFAAQSKAQKDTVIMDNDSFEPANLTVSPGSTVIWINKSILQHTATSGTNCSADGKFDSGVIDPNQSFSYTFKSEGIFNYYCIPHCAMGMKGVITVRNSTGASTQVNDTTQSVTEKKNESSDQKKKRSSLIEFKSLEVINTPTPNTLPKKVIDFTIFHRFDNMIGPQGGRHILFGLDNMRDLRLGLSYGLTSALTIGIGRSKGDWFNSPYQEVKELYDGYAKLRIIKQDSSKNIPVSITAYGNTVYTAMKSQDNELSEAHFNHTSDRFSHSAQLIIAHNFKKFLSLQVMPSYVRRNWVNECVSDGDDLDIYAIGAAARWAFSNRYAIIAEYFEVISDYRRHHKDQYFNPFAIGFEINTGGHVFHINLSNSTGIIQNTFLPYTNSSWDDEGFRLGFSIARKFDTNDKKRKKQ